METVERELEGRCSETTQVEILHRNRSQTSNVNCDTITRDRCPTGCAMREKAISLSFPNANILRAVGMVVVPVVRRVSHCDSSHSLPHSVSA